jgi:hypothetical protein
MLNHFQNSSYETLFYTVLPIDSIVEINTNCAEVDNSNDQEVNTYHRKANIQ